MLFIFLYLKKSWFSEKCTRYFFKSTKKRHVEKQQIKKKTHNKVLHAYTFEKTDKMNNFPENKLTKQIKTEGLYKPVTIKEIKLVIKCPLLKGDTKPTCFPR